MATLLRLEELGKFILALIFWFYSGLSFWIFMIFLFLPDISLTGYFFGKRAGLIAYNCCHHQGLAIITGITGHFLGLSLIVEISIILLAHSSMDRILGYGLKYSDHFGHTHLGWIGKNTAFPF
ncbi:MAG: DUF4260 domain-containing protein [Bacteroidetes bacterium]|nr:DUF4260 domain-containing protein [Bacteroidota bacterium]